MTNTHKQLYPEQYNHELCGKIAMKKNGDTFTIYRVVNSKFGQLAMSKDNQKESWAVNTIEILMGWDAEYDYDEVTL